MKLSSGIILYRKKNHKVEFFLVRPGGPFYKEHQNNIWTFPKGEKNENESEEEAAKREFKEETGIVINQDIYPLGKIKLRKGKLVCAFYCERDVNPQLISSSLFEMEYPKGSGVRKCFPEIAEARWFIFDEVKEKIHPKLLPFIEQLAKNYIE